MSPLVLGVILFYIYTNIFIPALVLPKWATSHPDPCIPTKVVAFTRRDMVDSLELVVAMVRAVGVEVGGCQLGGIYGKCGIWVCAMMDWVDLMSRWIGRGEWALLGD